jgi:hypothetical protein
MNILILILSHELNNATSLVNLLLCELGYKLGTHYHGLSRELSLAKHLEISMLSYVNDGSSSSVLGSLEATLLTNESPELIKVNDGAEILVRTLMEITHTNLSEVTRMIFVHENSVRNNNKKRFN